MSLNSIVKERSSNGSVNHFTDCCLFGGECVCYRPSSDCKYLGKKIFLSKKGIPITKDKKLGILQKQLERCSRVLKKYMDKGDRINKLIEEIEAKE